jgi:excisionase family DNA binding protein
VKYPRENAGGAIHTVDEVSGLLGIPRPTLYRYLREYSIPHLRWEGRISIPEDSFDRIREARDLHKEGLGTETVRRQLREGSAPDGEVLDRRLDTLSRTVEDLREDVSFAPTLRTILVRQSLLISAVFNLTQMVEELLLASGKPRKRIFQDIETGEALPDHPGRARLGIPGEAAAGSRNVSRRLALPPTDFGALRRHRRRVILTILAVLALAACLIWTATTLVGPDNAEPSVSRATETAVKPPEAPNPAQGNPSQEEQIKIPDVSGRSLEAAIKVISGAGFEVADIKTQTSPEAPETAIQTNPKAGAPAKPGAPVTLIMSAAPPTATPSATASATATASASSR